MELRSDPTKAVTNHQAGCPTQASRFQNFSSFHLITPETSQQSTVARDSRGPRHCDHYLLHAGWNLPSPFSLHTVHKSASMTGFASIRTAFGRRRNSIAERTPQPFMRLAKQQHFDAIAEVLVEEKIDICDWIYAGMCTKTEDTPLHYLVKFRPPLSLVDLLIRRLSEYIRSPEEARDASGRNPLHVATAAGCHVAVIRRLLQGTKSGLPAMMKDEAGRYALHYACLNSRGHNTLGRRHSQLQSLGSSADAENMVLVTFSILAAAPMASVMIDEEGYTPLHLAMNQRGDDRVIRSLTVTAAQYTNQGIGNKFQRAFGEKHSPVTTEASRTESGSSWDNLYQEHHDEEQRQQPAKSKVDDLMVFCDLHPDDVSTIGWEGASIMTPRSSAVPQHLERPPRVTSLGRGIMTMNQCNSCGQGEIVLESTSNKKSQNGQSLSEGNDEQVLARCWFI